MATLRGLKEEIEFSKELKDLLEVMKNIAVLQFRALAGKKGRFLRFSRLLNDFFDMLEAYNFKHPYPMPDTDKVGIVAITSEEGFMGGLNLKIINAANTHPDADKAEFIIVGERGARYFKETGRKFTAFSARELSAFAGKEPDFAQFNKLALELKNYLIKVIKEGAFGRVLVIYSRSVSFMIHNIEIDQLLPIPGRQGNRKNEAGSSENLSGGPIIVESPIEGIIEYLTEEAVFHKLIEVLEESKLSEYAARTVHLEKSNQDLTEKEKQLKFRYFRAYHEVIDKNTRELFSAQLIRRKQ